VSAYNRWRATRHAGDGWFAACAAGRLSLCRIESGAWRSVRSQQVGADLERELRVAVEREALALGVDPGEGSALHLFAPEHPRWTGAPALQPSRLEALVTRGAERATPWRCCDRRAARH